MKTLELCVAFMAVPALMLGGCSGGQAPTDSNVLVTSADYRPVDVQNLSDVIEITDVVPLETNDSSLIAEINSIFRYGNRYYILDSSRGLGNMSMKVFGRDGRFIGTFGRVGDGPGELSPFSRAAMDVADDTIYLVNVDRLMTYTVDGDFVDSRQLPYNGVADMDVVDDGFIFYAGNDSVICHITDRDLQETASAYPANSLTSIGVSNPIITLPDSRRLFTVISINEAVIYDPATRQVRKIAVADMPGMQELDEYEATVKTDEFGLPRGTFTGTVSCCFGASSDQSFVVTADAHGDNPRLWATIADGEKCVIDLDGVTDDITHSSRGPQNYFYIRMTGPEFTVSFTPDELLEWNSAAASADPRIDSILRNLNPEANPIIVTYRFRTQP